MIVNKVAEKSLQNISHWPIDIPLVNDQLTITTKRIYLHPIGYFNPIEINESIYLIKKTHDAGQTFETIVGNK